MRHRCTPDDAANLVDALASDASAGDTDAARLLPFAVTHHIESVQHPGVLTDVEVERIALRALTDGGVLSTSQITRLVGWATNARIGAVLLDDLLDDRSAAFKFAGFNGAGEPLFEAAS